MPCTPTCVTPSPSQAHCGWCHISFGSVKSGFDVHRKAGACLNPAQLGMRPDDRGVWRKPITPVERARIDAAKAARESGDVREAVARLAADPDRASELGHEAVHLLNHPGSDRWTCGDRKDEV